MTISNFDKVDSVTLKHSKRGRITIKYTSGVTVTPIITQSHVDLMLMTVIGSEVGWS